jgi:manganese oxidase
VLRHDRAAVRTLERGGHIQAPSFPDSKILAAGTLLTVLAVLFLGPAPGADAAGPAASDLPPAGYEDFREPAGRMVDGVLRIDLEARPAAWRPWGEEGPAIVAYVFAADGGAPRTPGPLIRVTAGTPVEVTLRNTFDHPLVVRGLHDRSRAAAAQAGAGPGGGPVAAPPGPLPGDSVVVAPHGETRVTFVPQAPGTWIYGGDVEIPRGTASWGLPGAGEAGRGLSGVMIVDPPEGPGPEERFFLISHWADADHPASWLPATRFFLNGRSWPHTERLEYAQGDTVRWRVINLTGRPHPMHLHGFYFNVDGRGDMFRGDALLPPEERWLAVTERLAPGETMRISWVAEEPGGWVFHCHFMRHMSWIQTAPFASAGPGEPPPHGPHTPLAGEDALGGLVLGITVHPRPDYRPASDVPRRSLRLHITRREEVFGSEPAFGFVLQEGGVAPAADSVHFPGSPIVLTRGEPTEILVHNRADVPLGVHWHGLELESWADGVPGISGFPGRPVPAIAPGDSFTVRMTPPRAGTFMYHVHSEPRHELAAGLYGSFLVLEPGERWDRARDRVFLLGSLGVGDDPPPAVNGELEPGPIELEAGVPHRLRFMHISPDDDKRVRLVRVGGGEAGAAGGAAGAAGPEPVRWTFVAKDGADLPAAQVREVAADLSIHVGETYDFLWTPEQGEYLLQVVTTFDRGAPAFPRPAPPPHTAEIRVRVR